MARAQEKPAGEPDYLDHFGLTRPPFAPLSDAGEIHDVEQYGLLSAHLDAAAQDTDHLVVVRGAEGSGKTTLLNRYMGSLGEEAYFATVDQTCENETSFYCSFLQQLGFNGITGKPGELRHIANEFLAHRARAGDTVLLIIDNVQHVRPSVLEQLRLIAATTIKGRRVISVVITGNSNTQRIMESPAMQGVRFREFVDFHIRAYTERETSEYIRHRLGLAGVSVDKIFLPDSYPIIHRFSGGIPGQINRLCDAVLTDAMERKAEKIDGELVRAVAEARQFPPHVIPAHGKRRRKSDVDTARNPVLSEDSVPIAARAAPADAAAQPPRRESMRVDTNDLLERLARVSGQIEKLKAEKQKASQEISERDRMIAELTEKLADQSTEATTLARNLHENEAELERLRSTLAEAGQVQQEFGKAEEKIGRLESLQSGLQQTVAELQKELEASNQKAGRAVVLQRELEIAGEKMGRIETLQRELEAAREECARLQSDAVARVELEATLVEKDSEIERLKAEIAARNPGSTATVSALAESPKASEEPEPKPARSGAGKTVARFDVTRNGKILRTFKRDAVTARCMIGRGEDCEVRLDSKGVSRHHALLIRTKTSVSIEDLKSVNGTYVNYERVTRCELKPDDVIVIGDFQIRVRGS